MDINELAKSILCSSDMSAKLNFAELKPEDLFDGRGTLEKNLPLFPSRCSSLNFTDQRKKPPQMPKVSALGDDDNKAIILHSFANHELLAMELMALAILKFPEAPSKFRLDIGKTILEELRHFQMYQDRINHYGLGFGDVPVNGYFWNCLAKMQTPMDYVVQMSMTFEQANLDFMQRYQEVFTSLGDSKTAKVLQAIFQDEIGHVKVGVHWFDRWRDPKEDQWSSYEKNLEFPLSPRRAKGIGFAFDARVKAGLSEAYIKKLQVFNASKGRSGSLFYFNPSCESEWAQYPLSYTSNKNMGSFAADFPSIMLFLAKEDDSVLVPLKPSDEYLEHLREIGFYIPELIEFSGDIVAIGKKTFSRLHPWGWSPTSLSVRTQIEDNLVGKDSTDWTLPLSFREGAIDAACEQRLRSVREGFSKALSSRLRQKFISQDGGLGCLDVKLSAESDICYSNEDLQNAVIKWSQSSFESILVKGNLGSSGRNNIKYYRKKGLSENNIQWIEKTIKNQGCVVIEPWLTKSCDFSLQLDLSKKDPFLKLTRFMTDRNGQYKGHYLGAGSTSLPEKVIKKLLKNSQSSENFLKMLGEVATICAEALRGLGYGGLAGVDCFVYELDGLSYIRPIVEINPRTTMGHISLMINKRIAGQSHGLWDIISLKEVRNLGFSSFVSYAEEMMATNPVQKNSKNKITSGVFFTNDPGQAVSHLGRVTVIGLGADS